jgi:hypothetical protein
MPHLLGQPGIVDGGPPWRAGTAARNCVQSASAAQGERGTKCCHAWYDAESLRRPCIAYLDFRSLSVNNPSR